MKRRRFPNIGSALKFVPSGSDVHALRSFNFMNDGQPPSVKELAEKLGFFVHSKKLPNGIAGYLETEPFADKGFQIVVNERNSVTRRRWTVLHEIAHYYLHPRFSDVLAQDAYRADIRGSAHFYSTPDEILEEREANEWVEAIVFDQNALEAAVVFYQRNLGRLARHFGVSEKTLEIVLNRRGL
ncbi:ImmA/IrrE family metallo-endopeptidase [Sedimentitalea sp. JM2-8]|uniref:ImmA/IrrE family metallo-endopeptidase n=1 Tax=Sedimentitalea xiamensis TaxID=3050037 RepID=A0ABT7FBK1_9RHOB|nr:ImmA/IrrE family metallo-endopeptidase [Sedimentitalea xiamensis]MDK3072489.1 ImmA/IrrE family metallo-endopeptidase [Sedimentitalea xiamensis]